MRQFNYFAARVFTQVSYETEKERKSLKRVFTNSITKTH